MVWYSNNINGNNELLNMSELLTRIALYGDVLFMTFKLDYKKFEEGLKLHNDKWVQYNTKHFRGLKYY